MPGMISRSSDYLFPSPCGRVTQLALSAKLSTMHSKNHVAQEEVAALWAVSPTMIPGGHALTPPVTTHPLFLFGGKCEQLTTRHTREVVKDEVELVAKVVLLDNLKDRDKASNVKIRIRKG
eukprot:5761090-Amphidinium_carterae.1